MLTFYFLCLVKEAAAGEACFFMSFTSVWSRVAPLAKHVTNAARFNALAPKGPNHAVNEYTGSICRFGNKHTISEV